MAGMVWEGLKGGYAQIMETPGGFIPRIRVVVKLSSLMFSEFLGIVGLSPFALYAGLMYLSLPTYRDALTPSHKNSHRNPRFSDLCISTFAKWIGVKRYRAALLRNVRYGDAKRNLLDVYIPEAAAKGGPLPVALFAHGGVWACGEKWQFASQGALLADRGVLAVVVQYSLYPQVLVPAIVEDVSKALSWTMANSERFGGDPERVFMVGHSAGGHLASMVVWERLQANLEYLKANGSLPADLHFRMPHCIVGLAGVYNIRDHYEYEKKRGVHKISTMERAFGSKGGLSAYSPTLLFDSLRAPDPLAKELDQTHNTLDRNLPCSEILPSFILISSPSDITVPSENTIAFHKVLARLGIRSKLALYDGILHMDFIGWDSHWSKPNPSVSVLFEDIISIAREEQKLEQLS